MKRRALLQYALAGGTLTIAGSAGLLTPVRVLAESWPRHTFDTTSEKAVLEALFGDSEITPSDAVVLHAPRQGSSEAVPVSVETKLHDVEKIAITAAGNPTPLCSAVLLKVPAQGYYSVRIKLRETSPVTAYVQAGGKIYSATANVKITIGGYGIHHP